MRAPAHLTAALLRIGRWIASLGDVEIDPLALVVERAAVNGYTRQGPISCSGQSRLIAGANGWMAVTLAREYDFAAVPAWLETSTRDVGWDLVEEVVPQRGTEDLLSRARLLGLPVSRLGSVQPGDGPAVRAHRVGSGQHRSRGVVDAVVVDLSSLWSGPLCASLLQAAGARVVKVESATRPDAVRENGELFDLLHSHQESVALDFGSTAGRADLRRLLCAADVVIESARPRAMSQLGIDPLEILEKGKPRVWVSITGYGCHGDAGNWVALGDDAAVAGGLVAWDRGRPLFCGDAIADPVTGLVAAAAVLAAAGAGRWRLDIALGRVAATLAAGDTGDWRHGEPVEAPPLAMPTRRGAAPMLGQDNERVLGQLAGDDGCRQPSRT